jgi:hypothetical protein
MLAALILAAEMYTVKSGDTLSGIAGNAWPIVCADNHISDCNLIYPGQVLDLNGRSAAVTTSAVTSSNTAPEQSSDLSGTLSCSGLESLWESAGGSPSAAFMAAEIAMAESGGQQYATGPYGEEGYWQINPVNGSLATYNAEGNAHSAIVLSYDGTNWGAWTTYTEGLYAGRCL